MADHRKILIVAYAGQGHLNPAFRLATRLLKLGVHVTFSTSLSVLRRIHKETTPSGLTFAPFSDGHDGGRLPTTTVKQFVSDFATYGAHAVSEIISSAATDGRPFDHLVYTTVIPWAARVANALGVKSSVLWCQPATVLDLYYYYFNEFHELISKNVKKPSFPIRLPGLPPLTIADLPSFILPSTPKEHEFLLLVFKEHVDVLNLNTWILVNTFSELEPDSIKVIKKPKFLPIGPLIPSDFMDEKDSSESSLGRDFFEKPEDDYIQWLDRQPKSSVVYASFGTKAIFSMDQLEEMATGLLESGRPFLWVIGDFEKAVAAGGLSKMDELKRQGMVVGWCSQVVVLSHEAIGCFLMHGGWNSTMESLAAGVPTVVFSQWSDQGPNAKMIEDVWKTGVRVRRREEDGVVEGKEIKRCVEMVIGDEDMKRNAMKWRKMGREALNNGGPCSTNLQTFLDNL